MVLLRKTLSQTRVCVNGKHTSSCGNSLLRNNGVRGRGCSQGSTFGPLLWNIYPNDLSYDIDVSLGKKETKLYSF